MVVTYRDKLGLVAVELSDGELGNAISFCDGKAYFTADNGDYTIPISSLVQISLRRDSAGKEPICGQKA